MSEVLLAVDGVRAAYGRVEALRGVSIEVRRGEIVALIGANGAGKTTTLAVISGLLRPTAGRVLLEGEEIHRLPPHAVVARGVVQVPEGRRIFPRLTVAENLRMGAYLVGDEVEVERRMRRVFDLFPILHERRTQAGGTLSGGEQQMLAIGRALMSGPRLLLLDEPSLGLAPLVVARILQTLRAIHEEGVTILLVEQNARAALSLADRAYVLETGAVALTGAGRDLLADDAVRRAYLGES